MAIRESTKARALREAKELLQRFGYNGFSFQDIADRLRIKKPSLYDHYASKEKLGQTLIEEYAESFTQWTDTIKIFEPRDQVGAVFELYFNFVSDEGGCCPLSALTADFHSLPKGLRKPLSKLFERQQAWLTGVIREGQKRNQFRRDLSPQPLARLVMSLGIGCQYTSRLAPDPGARADIKAQVLKLLEPLPSQYK